MSCQRFGCEDYNLKSEDVLPFKNKTKNGRDSKFWKKDQNFLRQLFPILRVAVAVVGKKVSSFLWRQFHQHFTRSFYVRRSQKRKKTFKSSSFFRFWDLLA